MKRQIKNVLILAIVLALFCAGACPPKPAQTVKVEICTETGFLKNPWCPSTELREYEKGLEPKETCTLHKAPEMVSVMVCAVTHTLPTPWCPEKITVEFEKGKEPKISCGLHLEPDPVGPWRGTSFYEMMIEKLEDIRWYIDENKKAGGKAIEMFLNVSWGGAWKEQPFKIIRTDWTDDAFPGMYFPLYDLDQQDGPYWEKFRAVADYCHETRTALFIRIQDFVSLKNTLTKRSYTFRSNKQRLIDGILTGGIWGEPIKKWYKFQNQKLVEELEASGVVYFLAYMNEADYLADPGDSEEKKDQIVMDAHKWYFEDLMARGVPKERLIISHSRAMDKMKSWGYVLEIHGVNSDTAMNNVISTWGSGNKIFMNGDGPDQYAQGFAGDAPNKREPSPAQAAAGWKIVLDKNLFGWLWFNRKTENGGQSIRMADFSALAAIPR